MHLKPGWEQCKPCGVRAGGGGGLIQLNISLVLSWVTAAIPNELGMGGRSEVVLCVARLPRV